MPNYTPSNANLLVNSCVGVEAAPGSVPALPKEWSNQRTVFGYWSRFQEAPPSPIALRTPRLAVGQNLAQGILCNPTWWTVTCFGREICRQTSDGDPDVEPLSMNDISGPEGLFVTHLKARMNYTTLGVPRTVDFDIGSGIGLSVNATSVSLQLLVPRRFPTPAGDVNTAPYRARGSGGGLVYRGSSGPQTQPLTAVDGLVIDATVAGQIVPCLGPVGGQNEATYTETVVLNVGEQVAFAVPSAAKKLTLFAKDPDLLLPWCFQECGPKFGAIANVDFGLGPGPTSVAVPVPQNANFLLSPVGLGDKATPFVLRWGLEF